MEFCFNVIDANIKTVYGRFLSVIIQTYCTIFFTHSYEYVSTICHVLSYISGAHGTKMDKGSAYFPKATVSWPWK